MRIAHISTVHPRYDVRIFKKECLTLAGSCHSVSFFVADGKGTEIVDGIPIVDIGLASTRIKRAAIGSLRMFRAIRAFKPDVVHFHDPELIPLGLVLQTMGYKVIYDVHEDAPETVRTKDWLPFGSRHVIAFGLDMIERLAGVMLSGIVTATPHIAKRFPDSKTNVIQNFPLDGELVAPLDAERSPIFAYVGGLTKERGYREMVAAFRSILADGYEAEFHIAGEYYPTDLRKEAGADSEARIVQHGFLSRPQVADLLSRSIAGLVLYLPHPNHIEAQPNKMFEYMSAGVPVIASNYPLWKKIIVENNCGLCVDPSDPKIIADAMKFILDNPGKICQMGENGKLAVKLHYSWNAEVAKLLNLYNRIA